MLERIKAFLARCGEIWQGQSRVKKIAWISSLISLLVVAGVVTYLTTRVQYGVLFTDLSDADAGSVAETLKSENIPYKLGDNGKTILIPQNKVNQTRIDLAVDNKLPDSSTGFELFDSTSVMTTDEDRKVMYQRAVTGELEQAIASLNEVQKAKVMLVMPSQSVFSDSGSSKKAKASIVLTLKSGGISGEAVQGIRSLTTGAVEGLTQDNVKIVDSNGNLLTSSGGSSSSSGYNTKYMRIKKAYEATMEAKVKKLLAPIYGSNKIRVSIDLNLNFDAIENKTTTYSNPSIRSEEEQSTGSGASSASGESANNATNETASSSSSDNGSYSRTVNNELNTQVTKTISAPGAINRMTASVVVDGNISQTDQEKIQSVIQSAVGYNQGRGDTINIQGIDFAKKNKASSSKKKKKAAKNSFIWVYIVAAIGILVVIGAVVFTVMRIRKNRNDEYYDDYDVTAEADTVEKTSSATTDAATVEDSKPKIDLEKRQKKVEEDENAKKFADEHPEVVAELLKAWMKEK
ncbi:flagellar basal-body MS-ring/collar protein FliF [Liquorilactobacillus mali]|uniref:Flagellar M-ring protein n=1 Tax=Liquorilactobacillus mali TaxID=1618 RepID=A0A0R2FRM8_9LACO|nr:flagellar basal-body MS-ring/collar protein FliF [Liquorilactobacillus mali]KRN30750.1 flagellar MS-ring protein [Liquorilactobacillus mali]MDN7145688.1 flagellar basal-body MS-ring/collar protein FliF [Liquorilactobacillus mali]